jgi:ribosomal protein L7/L12
MLLKQGNKMGAVKLVNQSIADIGLKRAKLFVEMDEREFECFIEVGSCPIN